MLVTIHNNANQTFWIFYFLCAFGFLTQKQIKIDKKKSVKTFKVNSKQTEHAIQIANKVMGARQQRNQIKIKR